MDLNTIKAYGIRNNRIAWLTNPLRSIIWKFIAPFFYGFSREYSKEIQTQVQRTIYVSEAGIRKDLQAANYRLASIEEEISRIEHRINNSDINSGKFFLLKIGNEKDISTSQQGVCSIVGDNKNIQFLPDSDDHVQINRDDLYLVHTTQNTYFMVHRHDFLGGLILNGVEWEPHVRKALEEAGNPNSVAIDIGANIGIHTVTMSRFFHTVYAFEPQRVIYQALCGNLAINNCRNVITYNNPLYDKACKMQLSPQERQEVPIPMLEDQPDYDRVINAGALTFEVVEDQKSGLNAYSLDDLHIENVSLIKIDAQGADLRILQGAKNTITRCRPIILFEWERDLYKQHGGSFPEVEAFFTELQYNLSILQITSPDRQTDYIATPA
jgi:FkbM family methyltransferase